MNSTKFRSRSLIFGGGVATTEVLPPRPRLASPAAVFRATLAPLGAVLALGCSSETRSPEAPVGVQSTRPATSAEGSPSSSAPGAQPAAGSNAGASPSSVSPPEGIHPVLDPGQPAAPGEAPVATVARRVIVSAGALSRDHSIVSFAFPEGVGAAGTQRSFNLRDAAGRVLPLQVSEDGTAVFILDALGAGQQLTFTLEELAAPPAAAIAAMSEGDAVRVRIGTSTLLDFQTLGELPAGVDPIYLRGGYIHPLYTPAGVLVSGDYPVDHYHHHGIWSAWTSTDVNGHDVDFWNMAAGLGKVDFSRLDATWQGPVHAGFEATLEHTDLVPAVDVTALEERWRVTAYKTHAGDAPYFLFELVSTQKLVGNSPLNLHEYTYGGFALRGHEAWRDTTQVTFLTSEGADRIAADNRAGRWVSIGGNVGGRTVGAAMLGHSSNFRAPQKLRVHPTDPYLAFSPVKDGAFSLQPGVPYASRFRFVTFDGPSSPELLDRLWDDFATPPEARLETLPTAP
jgi:Methane oxygenase PmoA